MAFLAGRCSYLSILSVIDKLTIGEVVGFASKANDDAVERILDCDKGASRLKDLKHLEMGSLAPDTFL